MDARSYIINILLNGINGPFMCPAIPNLYGLSVEELLEEWRKQEDFILNSLGIANDKGEL